MGIIFSKATFPRFAPCQSCWHPGREVGGPLDATQRKCIRLHDLGNQALVVLVQVTQTLNVVCVPKHALCWIKLGGGLRFNDLDDSRAFGRQGRKFTGPVGSASPLGTWEPERAPLTPKLSQTQGPKLLVLGQTRSTQCLATACKSFLKLTGRVSNVTGVGAEFLCIFCIQYGR